MMLSLRAPPVLRDARVLVVEDEYVIADALCRDLKSMGVRVLGPVPSVDGALDLLDEAALDGAILDVKLGDDKVYPVAGALASRSVPFVFWTGYDLDARGLHADVPCIPKPSSANELVAALVAERRRATRLVLTDVFVSRTGDDWMMQVRAGPMPEEASDDYLWLGAGLLDADQWRAFLRVPLRAGVFYRVPVRYRLLLRTRLAIVG